PKAAYWRRDFAPASLGALMNALAVAPEGIILRRDFMLQNRIRVGDEIQMRISNFGQRAELTAQVVGELEYFPTWYPDPDPTKFSPIIVGNLEYIFEIAGGEMPYD